MTEIISDKIRLSDIPGDDTFRISRPVVTDALIQSLKDIGMLEKPYLVNDGNCLLPLTCHNRIIALRQLEVEKIDAIVIKQFDPDVFVNNTAIKVRRNEVGPAGKCRAMMIARQYNLYSDPELFCRRVLNVSHGVLDFEFAQSILNLPESVKTYIDIKDTGFKTIRDLVSLPVYVTGWIDNCLDMMQVRVNVFKMIVDHLSDLVKKDQHPALPVFDKEKADDRQLIDAVSRMRFPEYSRLKAVADGLVNALSFKGVSVEFPEFFESGRLTVKVDVSIRDSADDIRARFDGIDEVKIVELASLLK